MSIDINKHIRSAVGRASQRFDSLNIRVRKIILTICGLSVAIICGLTAFEKMLPGKSQWLQPTPMTKPINAYSDSVKQKVQTPAVPK